MTALDPRTAPFVERMRAAGQPELAIRVFCHHFAQLAGGASGTLDRQQIEALPALPDATTFAAHRAAGEAALARTVVVKLNGGLGTSMGLERAKSLLVVRDGLSFLDLVARQVGALSTRVGRPVPLILMNSFRTADDAAAVLAGYPELAAAGLPLGFCQHQIPKVVADTLTPPPDSADADLAWCPPGHGDLYPALVTSGVLTALLAAGYDYAFVSNADNLGAVVDEGLLGYLVEHDLAFVMEAADRTAADRKGGHLGRLADGRLGLRELAQCPAEELDEFQDVDRYRYFNTNSVWLHLPTLAALLDQHAGVLPLATICNRKTLDPRDPASPAVIQLETAMGSALSLFPRAAAVRVPRSRFSPVKGLGDLLAVRSDAYVLDPDWRLALHRERRDPPAVHLASAHYRTVDDLERRFPSGPPSLRHCLELRVEGATTFGRDVTVRGRVTVAAELTAIADGAALESS